MQAHDSVFLPRLAPPEAEIPGLRGTLEGRQKAHS